AIAAAVVAPVAISLLVSKKGTEWRKHASFVAAAAFVFLVLMPVTPYLMDVLTRAALENPPDARYETSWNRLREEPGVRDVVQLRVQNTGTLPWLAHGSGRVTLGYRWRNIQTAQVETGPITMLPHDVKPGQVVEVGVPVQTPAQPGKYFLFVE